MSPLWGDLEGSKIINVKFILVHYIFPITYVDPIFKSRDEFSFVPPLII